MMAEFLCAGLFFIYSSPFATVISAFYRSVVMVILSFKYLENQENSGEPFIGAPFVHEVNISISNNTDYLNNTD